MMQVQETMCCHLAEFQGMNQDEFTVKSAIALIMEECNLNTNQPERGGIMFTVAWDPVHRELQAWQTIREKSKYLPRYTRFVDYIRDNGLGTVTKVPAAINPNHNSYVKVGVWSFNKEACHTWCENNNIDTDEADIW